MRGLENYKVRKVFQGKQKQWIMLLECCAVTRDEEPNIAWVDQCQLVNLNGTDMYVWELAD